MKQLQEQLTDLNPIVCTGDMKDEDVAYNINRFQNDPSCKVMLATWQKMGTGITLTAASYAIFIDTPWTQAVFQQAQDRIHRIGSKKPVFIYNLVCRDTVDERVLELVEDKGAMSDYIVDDEKLTENITNRLRKYIQDLE